MSAKTKIVVIKLKDLLFYVTVAILCIIVLLMLYILFQPKDTTTNSTIQVRQGNPSVINAADIRKPNTASNLEDGFYKAI